MKFLSIPTVPYSIISFSSRSIFWAKGKKELPWKGANVSDDTG